MAPGVIIPPIRHRNESYLLNHVRVYSKAPLDEVSILPVHEATTTDPRTGHAKLETQGLRTYGGGNWSRLS